MAGGAPGRPRMLRARWSPMMDGVLCIGFFKPGEAELFGWKSRAAWVSLRHGRLRRKAHYASARRISAMPRAACPVKRLRQRPASPCPRAAAMP